MNHDSRSFEDELSSLKADVAVIRSNYVTKADLLEVRIELKQNLSSLQIDIEKLRVEIHVMGEKFNQSMHAQTWKMYGFAAVLVTVVHFATRAGY